jgi:hypothetical protein
MRRDFGLGARRSMSMIERMLIDMRSLAQAG